MSVSQEDNNLKSGPTLQLLVTSQDTKPSLANPFLNLVCSVGLH